MVDTDARRIRQVLDGLAENALRLLAPGRPLVLHVGAEATGGPSCRCGTAARAWRPRTTRWRSTRACCTSGTATAGRVGPGLGLALAARPGGPARRDDRGVTGSRGWRGDDDPAAAALGAGRPRGQDRPVSADLDALLATARVFAIPLVERFRGITVREGRAAARAGGLGGVRPVQGL